MALLQDGACKGRDTAVTRSQQKYHFYKRYRAEEIMDLYTARFFALFDNACFKCGHIARLDIDHHVPFSQGGRYEEGNLVALCQECNGDKKERMPAEFYTPAELERLAPLLAAQKALFAFRWDWDFWKRDRAGYLASVGLDEATIHRMLFNDDYRGYVGLGDPAQPVATIRVVLDPEGFMAPDRGD
jgi:hypothetical protein